MKGLLIKDFKLMMMQKNFFLSIIAIAVVLTVFVKNPSFIIGYLTFIGSVFTLSTISYDEFDNGNAFYFHCRSHANFMRWRSMSSVSSPALVLA